MLYIGGIICGVKNSDLLAFLFLKLCKSIRNLCFFPLLKGFILKAQFIKKQTKGHLPVQSYRAFHLLRICHTFMLLDCNWIKLFYAEGLLQSHLFHFYLAVLRPVTISNLCCVTYCHRNDCDNWCCCHFKIMLSMYTTA